MLPLYAEKSKSMPVSEFFQFCINSICKPPKQIQFLVYIEIIAFDRQGYCPF